MPNCRYLISVLAAALFLAGCTTPLQTPFTNVGVQKERILLWHTWSPQQTIALEAMLAAYEQFNPAVEVISIAIPEAQLATRLASRSQSGFGPDLLLADAAILYSLSLDGLIRDLAPLNLDLSNYLTSAVRMLSDDDHLYGLPMSVHTHVLYFNRTLVDTPPATIAELVERVEQGEALGQNPRFPDSYWGVGAFDGGIADSERRLLLGLGGFSNWLDFLVRARTLPGFVLDADPVALRQAFIDGDIAYYIGDSDQYLELAAAMEPDTVGVAPLPLGPNGGTPRPFLQLDALAFGTVSSRQEFREAINLAHFLTDVPNQLALATEDLGIAPANSQIRLTPSLPNNSLVVARQGRSAEAISWVNRSIWAELSEGALDFFDAYQQVSQGVLPPEEMITNALADFETTYGLLPHTIDPREFCPAQPAEVLVWHTISPDEAQILQDLDNEFEEICPNITLTLARRSAATIDDQFRAAVGNEAVTAPDMLLASSRWLAQLAEEGLLLDLTELAGPEFLQQFLPDTVESMRYEDRLYGIPESVDVLALLYNTSLVADPPFDVQQLAQSVSADVRAALPVGFFLAYWGMEPYGSFAFDSYAGRIEETEGLNNWLTVLQGADANPGIDFYFDYDAAEDAFAAEEAAYLVSGPGSLPRLRQALGNDGFRVVPLPNGPLKPGTPMLQVNGSMINATADEAAVDAALAFSRYLNLPANQARRAANGNHVSASVTVNLSEFPNLEGFREQAKFATTVVENSNFATLEAEGDLLYRAVLLDGASPEEAVATFVAAVHSETGVE